MALTAPSFTVNFNLVTGKFVIADTTDYAGEGISTGDVTGALVIDGPSGNIYDGSFTPGSTNSSIDLELDTDDEVVAGDYTFTYTIVVGGAVQPGTYDLEKEITYSFELPEVEIAQRVDCTCGKLYSEDNTDYGEVASTSSYTHTIKYPQAATEDDGTHTPDEEATTLEVILRPIYPGTFTTLIETIKTFTETGHTVTAEVTGSQEVKVACANLCDFSCALRDLWGQIETACGTDKREHEKLLTKYLKAIGLVTEYGLLAERCGNDEKMSAIRADLVEILGECECDCDDCPDEDGWIWGVCGSTTETSGSGGGSGGSSGGTITGTGILSIVDNGDGTFTVNLTNGDSYTLNIPSGAAGAAGANGADGAQMRFASFDHVTTNSTSFADMDGGSALTFPAGRFASTNDGFDLEVMYLYNHVSGTDLGQGQINLNDTVNTVNTLVAPIMTAGNNAVMVKIRALRTGASQLKYKYEIATGNFGAAANYTAGSFTPSNFLIVGSVTASNPVDFTKALTIELFGKVGNAASELKRAYYTITEINAI